MLGSLMLHVSSPACCNLGKFTAFQYLPDMEAFMEKSEWKDQTLRSSLDDEPNHQMDFALPLIFARGRPQNLDNMAMVRYPTARRESSGM